MKRAYILLILLSSVTHQLIAQNAGIDPIRAWQNYAVRTDWQQHIAFDYFDVDGYLDLAVTDFNKTHVRFITEDVEGLPQRHIGNPTCHPDGMSILFNSNRRDMHCDIYQVFPPDGA